MPPHLWEFLETGADLAVRVGRRPVATQAEQAITLVLTVDTASIEHNATGIIAARVRSICFT